MEKIVGYVIVMDGEVNMNLTLQGRGFYKTERLAHGAIKNHVIGVRAGGNAEYVAPQYEVKPVYIKM